MTTLLLVDDEAELLSELDELLGGCGFRCLCAHDAEQALSLLEAHPDIELVITDLRMPDASGLSLLQRLRGSARGETLPVIGMSGNADMHDVIGLLRLGIVDFLPKPIHYEHLFTVLRRLFPNHQI